MEDTICNSQRCCTATTAMHYSYENIFAQQETPTTFGKLSTDKNSTPWSKTKPLFRAFKHILSPCNINVILDLHVSHVGGEAQKNILSIILWAVGTIR